MPTRLPYLLAIAIAALFSGMGSARADLRLLMIEQPGCMYCQQWDQQIWPKYDLTEEGQTAPLQRLQLRAALPLGLETVTPATFTPTFVLVRDGIEVGRIEGYPGEDFFWGLLDALIAKDTTARAIN
ncbi:MAG: thioredoxin family protein [Paracoccaceae bacterium]